MKTIYLVPTLIIYTIGGFISKFYLGNPQLYAGYIGMILATFGFMVMNSIINEDASEVNSE